MVSHRGRRILELVAREDADDPFVPADHAFGHELLRAGHTRGAGRLAAKTAGSHLCLGVENLLLRDFADHAIADFERPQALVEIHGPVDLDGAGNRVGPFLVAVELVVVVAGGREIGPAAFPAEATVVIELVEGVGAGGVDHGQPGNAVDQAELAKFGEGLAEGARVAEVAARHHDPVGNLPPHRLEHPIHNRLLAFESERVDAVDEIDAELAGHLLDTGHGVVEVACDLNRQRTVVERLRELSVGDLSGADEDDATHQTGDGAVDSQ